MKYIKFLIISFICSILLIPNIMAATGTINISGANQVVNGNKVTVTVTISSSTKIGSWQMNLNYDKNYLKLTSSTAENGTTMANAAKTDAGVSKQTYTFTFKALKTGSTSLSIGSALVYPADVKQMNTPLSLTLGKKTIKIITQADLEASYSKDNNLKSLSIEGYNIEPGFKKDVTEYNVSVPENTKTIEIKAQANDSKATVTGAGEKDVSAGMNNFTIVVRAENGSEKKYLINVDVKDSNPIKVNINNTEYTVVKIREYLPEMKSYDDETIVIDNFEIPAYKSSTTNIVLVGLKDKVGIIEMFRYEDGKYLPYQEISTDQLIIFPKETNKELVGYEKNDVDILGVNTTGWIKDIKSNYIVIYGIDLVSGNEGFWTYDKKNNTLISFDDSFIKEKAEYERKLNLYSYIIIGYSGILILLIIIVITKGKKKNTVVKQKEIEDERTKNKTKKK